VLALPNRNSDIVAALGDPVNNIKATQSVFFVIKDGKIYRNDRAPGR